MKQEKPPWNDNLLGPSIQLTIMLLLYTHKQMKFTILQKLLGMTPGNLDYHLKKLAKEGYLELSKRFFPHRPLTIITITAKGRKAFQQYIEHVRDVLAFFEK